MAHIPGHTGFDGNLPSFGNGGLNLPGINPAANTPNVGGGGNAAGILGTILNSAAPILDVFFGKPDVVTVNQSAPQQKQSLLPIYIIVGILAIGLIAALVGKK